MKDYIDSGFSIRKAKIDQSKYYTSKEDRPDYIIWGEKKIYTAFPIEISGNLTLTLEFLSNPDPSQGVDIKVQDGEIAITADEKSKLLRTWHTPEHESTVSYDIVSSGIIWVYNVYKEIRGNDIFEEKWTGNAGMHVKTEKETSYEFHCSPSWANPPNFDSLIFRIQLKKQQAE